MPLNKLQMGLLRCLRSHLWHRVQRRAGEVRQPPRMRRRDKEAVHRGRHPPAERHVLPAQRAAHLSSRMKATRSQSQL